MLRKANEQLQAECQKVESLAEASCLIGNVIHLHILSFRTCGRVRKRPASCGSFARRQASLTWTM